MHRSVDLKLVQAVRSGDAEAFERMYGRFLPPVARFARKQCSSNREAEEPTGAILAAVFSHLEGYTGRVALDAWVLVVARRVGQARPSEHAGGATLET